MIAITKHNRFSTSNLNNIKTIFYSNIQIHDTSSNKETKKEREYRMSLIKR